MAAVCPLCETDAIEHLEVIDANVLNHMWERRFGILGAVAIQHLDYFRCTVCQLRFFEPPAAGGPDLYSQLQQFDWYYMAHKPEFDLALPHLSGKTSVLEVGAGEGAFARFIGERSYVGLESNPKGIEAARSQGLSLMDQSIEDHAEAGNRYDVVVAFQVLEHVPLPSAFLRSCIQCLKPGGRLIVAVPSHDGFVGKAINSLLNMPPHHVTHWTDETFVVASRILGVRLRAIVHEPVADYHETWARSALIESRLRDFLRFGPSLVDRRPTARLIARASIWAGSHSRHPRLDGVAGHTVLAVFERDHA